MGYDWFALGMGITPSRKLTRFDGRDLQDWDEDRTKFGPRVFLRASTWEPYTVFPDAPTSDLVKGERNFIASPNGTMGYTHTIWPKGKPLRLAAGEKRGDVYCDGDVIVPALWMLKGGKYDKVWMSYTPMECMTQRKGILLATGTVVLGGLGMGWLLTKIHAKKSVKRIIVVEKDRGLLDWFGTKLCEGLPKVTDVICDDVRNHYGAHGDNARHLIDIWPGYGDAPQRPEEDARNRGLKVWCWGEYALRMQRVRMW